MTQPTPPNTHRAFIEKADGSLVAITQGDLPFCRTQLRKLIRSFQGVPKKRFEGITLTFTDTLVIAQIIDAVGMNDWQVTKGSTDPSADAEISRLRGLLVAANIDPDANSPLLSKSS